MACNDTVYRDIYPNLFFEKVMDMGLNIKGSHVLDLSAETGNLPEYSYKYKAEFTGGDTTENQIEWARRLSENARVKIEHIENSAQKNNFSAQKFDVVTSCQSYMYFNESTPLPKIHGMLKDGGHFCAFLMAWLPDESGIVLNSEKLISKYNPAWTDEGMKKNPPAAPQWPQDLFEAEKIESFKIEVNFTRESWHKHIKAYRAFSAGYAASLSGSQIAGFEKEHTEYLKTVPETFDIPHYVTILNLRRK